MNFPLLFLLLLLCCVFSAIELATNRSYGIFFSVLAVLFVFVLASRGVYNTLDTGAYVEAFEQININSGLNVWEWNKTTFESGYMLMNLILKWAGFDYRAVFVVVSLLDMFAYFYGINNILTENKFYRRKHFYCVSFSIWFGYYGAYYSGVVIRAGVALMFSFLAYTFVRRRKFLVAIFLGCFAFTFHKSVIIFFFILFLSKYFRLQSKSAILTYISVIIVLETIHFERIFSASLINFLGGIVSGVEYFNKYTYYYDMDKFLQTTTMFSKKIPIFAALMVLLRDKDNPIQRDMMRIFIFNLSITFIVSAVPSPNRIFSLCNIFMLPAFYYYVTGKRIKLIEKIFMLTSFTLWQFSVSYQYFPH